MKNHKSISIKFLYPFLMLALLVGGITFGVQRGQASTMIVVNSTADSLANDNMCTLREAIISANKDKRSGSKPKECPAGSGADTIILPNNLGNFVLTRADSGKEDSSATGDLDVVSDITILGDGPGVTIVGVSGDHVFHILSGQVTIQGLTIKGGNLPTDGGGIRNQAQLTLRDVTLSGNTAGGSGGAIYNAQGAVLTIANSTLSGNQAGGSGGGIYNDGTATLNNVTIAENTAVNGGGVSNENGALTIQNTIVAGNFSSSDCSGTLTSGGYNLIQDASGCTISGDTTGNLTGINPNLGELGDHGGSAFTYEPGAGSPAIDAGSPSVPGSGGNACEQTDQRGTYRPHGEVCDIGAVEVGNTNVSVLVRAFTEGSTTTVVGRLTAAPDTIFTLQFYTSTDPNAVCSTSDGGTPVGEPVQVTTDSSGNIYFIETIPAVPQGEFLVATTSDPGGFSSDYSQCVRVGVGNDSWPHAMRLTLDGYPNGFAALDQYIDLPAQSRWYKFSVEPHSKVVVTLTDLPANYDLTVYKDIAQAFTSISSNEDLLRLGAEFAPDAFSPDAFSPDAFSPDAFSPDAFSPDAFSPDAFSPDAFSPDAFSPDAFSPDAFSPDAFSPDAFSPDAFSPDAFSPDAFSPDAFSPDAFSPDAFSSAQTRSLVAISAFDGQVGEGVLVRTWDNEGDYYIRVRGRSGAFNPIMPFHLEVRQYSGICGGVSAAGLPPSNLGAQANGYKTVILTSLDRMQGTQEELDALAARLNAFALRSEVNGVILNVSQDARVEAAYAQSVAYPDCPTAQNLLASSIKELVDQYWNLNPLEYVVIIGGDDVIPFFRHADHAMLANEQNYAPPVRNGTISQSSLRLGNVLSQDDYGSRLNVSLKEGEIPIPVLGVGRLVETASDANTMLDAYLSTAGGVVPTPSSYLVTAYDFLEDTGLAVLSEFQIGGGAGGTYDSLITPSDVAPTDPSSWSADDLRAVLLGQRHDLIFLAGHFSGNSALAADFSTRILAGELVSSDVDLTNAILFSAGCHVGYNIVDDHGVLGLTRQPDWGQAAAAKGLTLIGGTGYQYGDTDFIKYSEELYLEFSRQLRVGSGPVSIGQALVKAKQSYLADTPYLRGIDEKALLEATIFGLPMLSVDMPGERLSDTSNPSIVSSTSPYAANPGLELGLTYADINVNTPTTLHSVILDNVSDPSQTSTAYYFSGEDTIVVKPNEPTLPKQIENVSVQGTVLRGVGFRSGAYTDLLDVLPFTGAAATEIRGVHAPFLTDTYFPQKLYSTNYFDALADSVNGKTNLFLYPAQYKSSTPSSLTGTWRTFQSMGLRLFYSANTSNYNGSIPAMAAAPTIAMVSSQVGVGQVTFSVRVVGNPAAGITEVWLAYTDVSNPMGGSWQSLDLSQNESDSTLWEGSLTLPVGVSADEIRYIVQAVNGVGLVSMDTNQGRYYVPGAEAGPSTPTELAFVEPVPVSGRYTTQTTLSARLTSNGTPLADQAVMLSLGPQSRLGITDADGVATVTLSIYGLPGEDRIRASFAGAGDYQASYAESPFTILKQLTQITLDPQPASGYPEDSVILTATLTDVDGQGLGDDTLIFYVSGSGGTYGEALVTDFAGRAKLGNIPLPPGSYTVDVYFSGEVTPFGLSLSDTRYEPAFASGSLNLTNKMPVAADDAYQVNEDETLIVDAPGVLGNDSDPDGQPLSAVLVSDVSEGTLNLNSDGSFNYAPPADFFGEVSFTYQASDGMDLSNVATVTITVVSVNDPPICSAVLNITSLWPANNQFTLVTLSGATDPEGDPVTITIVSVFQDEPVGPQPDAIIYGSSADIRAERDGFGDGRVYHITYMASDGQGGTCNKEVLLGVVPHDQSGNLEPIDQGPLYDSTIAQ
jgi:CSLREA domain-containing protein